MSSYRKKKLIIKIILIALVAIIIGLNVWWSISIYNQYYSIWLNEYNAQMAQLGYYKEDINLLNQYATNTAINWQLAGNIIIYVSPFFGLIGYLAIHS